MTSRNWVRLFLRTLAIGGFTTVLAGFIVRWNEFEPYFADINIFAIGSTAVWLTGMGFLFSIVSQMGFFSYLMIHRIGLGIFKSLSLWNGTQMILILFVLFDFVYVRYEALAENGDSFIPYIGLAVVLIIVSAVVSWFKMKQSSKAKGTFIPALFFMIVATIIEWLPVLKVNETSWLYLMLSALLACNAYQLLVLPKLNASSEVARKRTAANHLEKRKNKTAPKTSI